MRRIAVLMGGWSSEREVSLSSGKACADALESSGERVERIDVNRDIGEVLNRLKPDIAFNALHGPFGEDGTVQGILEFLQIPYTHSGVMASSLAMNKVRAKIIAAHGGVAVAESKVMSRFDAAKAHAMEPPYVVKPISEGSSFGVRIVREGASAPPADLGGDDWAYKDEVMVERYVPGRELTCAVMGERALGVIEIVSQGRDFYDFEAKYAPGGSKHILPADILPNIYQKVRTMALAAHKAIGCRGISRSDFRFDDCPQGTGDLIWLEVNTQPGMTSTSLVPELALEEGYDFAKLLQWMVEDASCSR